METSETVRETNERRRKRTIVAVVAAVALCCACLALSIAIYSFSSVRGGQPQDLPAEGGTPLSPDTSLTPSFDPNSAVATVGPDVEAGEAPTGGLGDETLRNDTWQYVAAAAAGQGCDQPVGADSTIEVLQEPDASGIWMEQWTVACESGDTFAYEVEYIPDATGTTFNINSIP